MAALSRYFLALLPDDAARAALAAVPLPSGARAVHPQDLHLTLAFLGNLRAPGPEELLDALAGVGQGAVEVVLDAVEYWPGPRLACAVGDAPGPAALAAALWQRLPALGYTPEERPFRSHVTLGRKIFPPLPERVALVAPIRWTGPEVVLMVGGADVDGPRYLRVGSRSLGA